MFRDAFYFLSWLLIRILLKIYWRLKIFGYENIPKKGPAIITPNHISLADPPIIGASIKKELYFLAKYDLFQIPIFGWLLKQLNGIPLKRQTADLTSIRRATSLLKKGKFVVVFPQGSRRKENDFSNLKDGISLLHRLTNSPIIPARIVNSNKMKRFKTIEVYFSKPIKVEKDIKEKIVEAWKSF